jgi:ribosome-binding factor A
LCRQVQKALHTALEGECGDELLQQLSVVSVESGADSSFLEVRVELPPDRGSREVLAHLENARGLLRSLVAQAISRKKVPDLVFRIAEAREPGS